jgi:uncharacterized repeat protein (TIGR03806 family)
MPVWILFTLPVVLAGDQAAQVKLPSGFAASRVADGLTGTTAMEIAPDGRILVCEQTGTLRIIKDGSVLPTPAITLNVDSAWERGLLGVALDPRFTDNHFVYLNYVSPDPFPHHRISRFTMTGDVLAPHSEKVLFEGDDQRTLGGEVPAGHQGGAIHFGLDGKLYIALGEQTAGQPAQRMDTLLGKMLRIDPDGRIPEDNPFAKTARGKYRAIWALGLRNPFTFAVQPGTGRIYINDVGGNFEEINEGHAGANYGWPIIDHGPTSDPRFRGAIYHYPVSSITGGAFCPAGRFPAPYAGRYFFLDFTLGWIKTLDPEHPSTAITFASGLTRPVDLKFGRDGSLFVLTRNAWVKDKDFQPRTGALLQIRYDRALLTHAGAVPALKPEPPAAPPPRIAPASGTYSGPITIAFPFKRRAVPIRYTTDGSAPDARSRLYDVPFVLDRSAVIKASSFSGEHAEDALVEAAYAIRGKTPYAIAERTYVRDLGIPLEPGKLPRRLSQTKLFTSLADLAPRAGLIPYTVISPLWSDAAEKRRWVAIPGGETIDFSKTGEWKFPRGTLFIKHFELALDETQPSARRKRLETRLLVADGTGSGYGVTYRWRDDESDADLLDEGATETVSIQAKNGRRQQTWAYPSREDCLRCHTANAGFVLGPKTRQLNGSFTYPSSGLTDNQLRTWRYLGLFRNPPREDEIPGLDRLASLSDSSASVEQRARSYLDANCMHCHRPGANIPAAFDARFDTPLPRQGMIDAKTLSDSLGIASPKVIARGDVARSLLYQRMIQPERFKMPPLARNEVDRQAADVLRAWIESIPH